MVTTLSRPHTTTLPRRNEEVAQLVMDRLGLPDSSRRYLGFASLTPNEAGGTAVAGYVRATSALGGMVLRVLAFHRAMVLAMGQDAKANMPRANLLRDSLEQRLAASLGSLALAALKIRSSSGS
jgi:hypothetical protein